jgi:hypothetical protein
MKYNNTGNSNMNITPLERENSKNLDGERIGDKPEMTYRRKFLKNVTKKNFSKVNPFGLLLKNIIEKKLSEDQAITDEAQQSPEVQEDKTADKGRNKNDLESSNNKANVLTFCESHNKALATDENLKVGVGNNLENPSKNEKVKKLGFFCKLKKAIVIDTNLNEEKKEPQDQVKQEKIEFEVKAEQTKDPRAKRFSIVVNPNKIQQETSFKEKSLEEPRTARNLNSFFKGFNITGRDIMRGSIFAPRVQSDDATELKLLRKEKQLNSQVISNLTRELTELHAKTMNFDKILIDYQEILKNVTKKEHENLKLTYGMIKDFFNEEIIYSKNLVDELQLIIDDIVINEKSIKDIKNNKVLCK